jgi:hypothetical protein
MLSSKKCGIKFHVPKNKGEMRGHQALSDTLLAAIRRVFRPLARLLIARSIPFPLAANLLRGVYVDVAVSEFPVAGRAQSDSRITLLTGVHRKDVKRLRGERHRSLHAPRSASLGSQLIAAWTTQPEYLDDSGAPRPLPRTATAGASFESLVRSLNTDIRPRVVLDEWLRLEIARIDDEDRVCLNVQAFIPREGTDEMTYYFGRNVHDHLAAAVHNMLGEGERLLERSLGYNNLSSAAVTELTELAQRRGMEILQELNARALVLQRRDSGTPGASNRFNLGLYLFTEDEAQDGSDTDEHEDS